MVCLLGSRIARFANRRRSSLLSLGSFNGLNFGSNDKDQQTPAKAEAIFGMQPGQRSLLVPGGKSTGE